ncbi:N-6 DNA methylase [Kitasatospora sp. NPDC004745]|uniref:N-6 DNA methylase n=1 Tax=Kitasatospora sp. NPDC004745 TaxID=3364019 RepID=UPI003680907A
MQLDIFAQAPEPKPALRLHPRALPAPAPAPSPALAEPATGPTAPLRRLRMPSRPHEAAFELGEAVAAAWFRARGDHRMEIPIGVIAGTALWPFKGDTIAPIVANWWRGLTAEQTTGALRDSFARWWVFRPDLAEVARPIHEWLTDETVTKKYAEPVRAALLTALDYRLTDLTGSDDPYLASEADVLGPLLAHFRSRVERDAYAEFHTPPEMADLMARVLLGGTPEAGQAFTDPASGTGGLMRSYAQALRERNADPADYRWSMNDINPVAAACSAVNATLWGLGPDVLVWCGDTLTEPDGGERAARARAEVIEHRNRHLGVARMVALLDRMSTPEGAEEAA